MSISKKLRFEVFKRDGFTCQYCGSTPPKVTLEVDHIQPKSKNGNDDINNLITACFDCNRGKKNYELNKLPNSLILNIEVLKEKEKQYLEYQKLLNKINKRISFEINEVDKLYTSFFNEFVLSEKFKNGTIKKFLEKLGFSTVYDAMYKSCSYIDDSNDSIKYFCGICWNRINNK